TIFFTPPTTNDHVVFVVAPAVSSPISIRTIQSVITGAPESSSINLVGSGTLTLNISGDTNLFLPATGVLIGTDVTALANLEQVGTIGTGVWQGTPVDI